MPGTFSKSRPQAAPIGRLICLIAFGLLSGCRSDPNSAGPAVADDPVEPKMVVKQSAGKPSPPIDIEYSVLGEPAVGQPLEIELRVGSALPGSTMQLRLQPKDDLVLDSSQQPLLEISREATAKERPAAERMTRRVRVVPQSEGRSYLVVSVTIPTDEGSASKVLAVPIQVGDLPPRLERSGTLSGEGDDAVISMPAKETRKP